MNAVDFLQKLMLTFSSAISKKHKWNMNVSLWWVSFRRDFAQRSLKELNCFCALRNRSMSQHKYTIYVRNNCRNSDDFYLSILSWDAILDILTHYTLSAFSFLFSWSKYSGQIENTRQKIMIYQFHLNQKQIQSQSKKELNLYSISILLNN